VTDKTVAPPPLPTTTTTTNDENEPKSKNGYNAVQISIELQKKMLK
jgi:hypothetical protein